MNKEQEEIYNAILDLQEEYIDKYNKDGRKDDEVPEFVMSISANEITLVNLSIPSEEFPIDIPLYLSIEEDRRFFEKTNSYEAFKVYLKRKIRNFKKEISLL